MPNPFPNLPPAQRGTIHWCRHVSTALQDNHWRDPSERDLLVYTPPNYDGTPLPAVLMLAGLAGTGEGMLGRGLGDVSIATRIDRLIAGGAPPFLAVLPDGMTRVAGSQYVDSPSIGRYGTWAAREIPAFVETQFPVKAWAVIGRSSGGFGALHLAMNYPGVFRGVGCHAGDMGFDLCYLGDLGPAVRGIQEAGGARGFVDAFWAAERPSRSVFAAMNILAMSCAFSPDPRAEPFPARLPINFATGAVDFDVLRSWGRFDPISQVSSPEKARALAELEVLWLDAGSRDEYLLHLGARRFVAELDRLGISHSYEEFSGGHRGTTWRYDVSLPALVGALA